MKNQEQKTIKVNTPVMTVYFMSIEKLLQSLLCQSENEEYELFAENALQQTYTSITALIDILASQKVQLLITEETQEENTEQKLYNESFTKIIKRG